MKMKSVAEGIVVKNKKEKNEVIITKMCSELTEM